MSIGITRDVLISSQNAFSWIMRKDFNPKFPPLSVNAWCVSIRRVKLYQLILFFSVKLSSTHPIQLIKKQHHWWKLDYKRQNLGLHRNYFVIMVDRKLHNDHMWYDQAKWVWTRIKWKLSFPFQCMLHCKSSILMKTPSKLNIPSQRYSHFSDAQNHKIQKELNTIIGYIF